VAPAGKTAKVIHLAEAPRLMWPTDWLDRL